MLGCAVTCNGSLLQASSFSFAQLIVGRLITGVGFGAISATAPNWQTECARAGHRGFVVMLESLFISLGLAVSGWINYGMSYTTGPVPWRFSLAFSCFFAILVFCSLPFWPESPRWLIMRGRVEDAHYLLAALDDVPLDDPTIAQDIRGIEISL